MRTTENVVRDVLTDAQREAWRACRAPGEMPVRAFAAETERAPGTVGNHLRWAENALRDASDEFAAVAREVDFLTERDDGTSSWQRASTETARVRYVSPTVYVVALDGGRHLCTLHETPQGFYRGACDCKGWEYNDGPCAHLCALRMADYVHETTVRDRKVRVPTISSTSSERAVADGGRVVEREPRDGESYDGNGGIRPVPPHVDPSRVQGAGEDGRVFGRPEDAL